MKLEATKQHLHLVHTCLGVRCQGVQVSPAKTEKIYSISLLPLRGDCSPALPPPPRCAGHLLQIRQEKFRVPIQLSTYRICPPSFHFGDATQGEAREGGHQGFIAKGVSGGINNRRYFPGIALHCPILDPADRIPRNGQPDHDQPPALMF